MASGSGNMLLRFGKGIFHPSCFIVVVVELVVVVSVRLSGKVWFKTGASGFFDIKKKKEAKKNKIKKETISIFFTCMVLA